MHTHSFTYIHSFMALDVSCICFDFVYWKCHSALSDFEFSAQKFGCSCYLLIKFKTFCALLSSIFPLSLFCYIKIKDKWKTEWKKKGKRKSCVGQIHTIPAPGLEFNHPFADPQCCVWFCIPNGEDWDLDFQRGLDNVDGGWLWSSVLKSKLGSLGSVD